MSALDRRGLERFRPARATVLWGVLVLNTELLLTVAYLSRPDVSATAVRYYVYPFVWINLGLWAIVRTYPVVRAGDATDRTRRRLVAGAIAVGYFAVLAYAGGLVHLSAVPTGFRIATLPPGYGPAVLYDAAGIQFVLLPFKLVGYLALAYLVYATAVDAAGSAVGGVLGLLSCVSCTWPVLATLAGGVLGGSAGVANAVIGEAYGLSTVVFVLTVGLLYWRPFGRD